MPKNVITHGLPFFELQRTLEKFRAYLLLSELLALINSSCRILCKKVDILEDSDREMIILQDSGRKNGYLASFWQNEWLSCKILAEILQDYA